MSVDDENELLTATRGLSEQVAALSRNITVSQIQARRTQRLTRLALALTILAILGVAATVILVIQVHEANVSNKQAQTTTCKTANDQRSASLTLWTFLIDQSKADTQQEKVALGKLKTWIGELYAPRDCSDLNATPPSVPPPPNLGLNGN